MISRIYSYWTGFCFVIILLFLYPFFLILMIRPSWKKKGYLFNKAWAWLFLRLALIPVEITYRHRPSRKQPVIYCANHFSYLDIPMMGLITQGPFQFIGKKSLAHIPLFGFIFRQFHLTVDRESKKDRYAVFQGSKKAIEKGYSLVIFPEGGMRSINPPQLADFKEGAFRLSIDLQIPIVPVTIADNWLILPGNGKLIIRRRKSRMIVHPPVLPNLYTLDNLDDYKNNVYKILNNELIQLHHESR